MTRAHFASQTARRDAATLAVVLVVQAMAIIDLTIVNVAAPTIQRELDTSGSGLQLIVSGYVITYAMSLITAARLGDRLGHTRVLRGGLAGFTLASLACGMAAGETQLIVFRLAQGIAAGVMVPQVMSVIQRTFAGPARSRALGRYAAVVATAAVLGQVAGGVLVSADVAGSGWRPVFLVNVPIGIATFVLAGRHLPGGAGETRRKLDPAGVVTSSAAVVTLVLPLILGHEQGWPLWCWASLALSAVAFAVFARVEASVQARQGSPLVSGQVLRLPTVIFGSVTILLAMAANSGFLFVFALYLQLGLRLSAVHTGLLFAAVAIGSGLTSLTWSGLPTRWHRWLVPLGLAGTATAFGLLAPIESTGRLSSGWLVPDLFVAGLLYGLAYSPTITLALDRVPIANASDASGILITMIQLGQVLGVAAIGTVYLSVGHHLVSGVVRGALAMAVCAVAAALSGLALASATSSAPRLSRIRDDHNSPTVVDGCYPSPSDV